MSKCMYERITNRGNEVWGKWICDGSMEDSMVQYCRKAFKQRYRDMWIAPVYFDDKYFRFTEDFFSEVGAELYPKLSRVPRKKPGMSDEDYRALIWRIAHEDIRKNIEQEVEPVRVIVTGVRYTDDSSEDGYGERYKAVYETDDFDIEPD